MSSEDPLWREFVDATNERDPLPPPKRTPAAFMGGIVTIILAWAAVFASVGVAALAFRWMAAQF